jgi:hypothetical protein
LENQELRMGSVPGASRAINIDHTLQAVTDLCKQHAIGISTIEALDSGGTRVVVNTAADAENLRRRVKGKLIEGRVTRSSLHLARQAPKY